MSLPDLLAPWNAFFGFLGGAAATLLGLLFVAASLRLNIFRDPQTADVRIFAGLTFTAFIGVLLSAGLSLAPHEALLILSLPHVAVGIYGIGAVIILLRQWLRLNPAPTGDAPGPGPARRAGWVMGGLLALSFVGLMLGGGLLLVTRPQVGLLVIAATDGLLLLLGTVNAWVMLGNAGDPGGNAGGDAGGTG